MTRWSVRRRQGNEKAYLIGCVVTGSCVSGACGEREFQWEHLMSAEGVAVQRS
ncbi:MAG: hypothetical protein NTZ78_07435 [Candidatus Aureabacteria bacterium]|nr:hypothetical protein [Candidatus Auribacterota bacterium]